ncbi:MAG: SUMF1/EgtB/PvdO family nonheme iron enzyme [Chitinivibrionales bacterium]|nr:SUMF1/EgtB/PvdO family nonheme iron enzyme [Chitinivibrionales bacterium]
MNNSRFLISSLFYRGTLLVLLCSAFLFGRPDTVPTWLDTIPPEITISPKEKYHRTIFHVSLEADEVATIFMGINTRKKMKVYRRPVTITDDGKVTIYFRGEDDFGNASELDSMIYVLDRRLPQLKFQPEPGQYRKEIVIHLYSDEPVQYFFHRSEDDMPGKKIPDSLVVSRSLKGFFSVLDSAGNRTFSDMVHYTVDTTKIEVSASPPEGLYSQLQEINLSSTPTAEIYYSFDPSAPADWFDKYDKPVKLPYGLTVLRYFARTKSGVKSGIYHSKYVVDTIAPSVRFDYRQGPSIDTVVLSSREKANIWYTLEGTVPTEESIPYTGPITVKKVDRSTIRARAKDKAGNLSQPFEWERKYDKAPPVVTLSHPEGLYTKKLSVQISANEPANIYYTLDGMEPTTKSFLYREPLSITKEGTTVLRCRAVDRAGNRSEEVTATYTIDTKPPLVKARIEQNVQENIYTVTLYSNEPVRIHYETGSVTPGMSSPVYREKLTMRSGQVLRYFALDSAGNRSKVRVMKDLIRPIVSASPGGGIFNRQVRIGFITNMSSTIKWRLLPDTTFRAFRDSIELSRQGTHSIEYYSVTADGMRSPFHRNEYVLDWTSPQVNVTLRRGIGDSVSVFFECSENATIYYTTDGSSPLFSGTVKMAANKFLSSRDRISVMRDKEIRLTFYAEDIAGNQSALSIYDLSKPRVTPNVPSGPERVYNRFLSVSLNTLDDRSQIYYSRHGNRPTLDSTLYTAPITLLHSDTIVAFVMDASGFKGDLDTFIYHIDLPPSARFTTSPDTIYAGAPMMFNALSTTDPEAAPEELLFRWDYNGDGVFDTDFDAGPKNEFVFDRGGLYPVQLEVKDPSGRTGEIVRKIRVHELCPQGMRYVIDKNGRSFCIDRYEWPNIRKKVPQTGFTWIEAKMECINAGKRLCTAQEWESACRGASVTAYPYGSSHEEKRCPDKGRRLFKSGSFNRCGEGYGLSDMVGNAWEWVDSRRGDYPLMVGGSITDGKDAHCGAVSPGTVTTRSAHIGFRCCR